MIAKIEKRLLFFVSDYLIKSDSVKSVKTNLSVLVTYHVRPFLMNKLNFPEYQFKIIQEENTFYIFDKLRKKRLVLTPEEWVRQHLITFLIEEKGFPKGLISMESGLKVNTLRKRYDALIYNKERRPQILIECKAPSVKINEGVFRQILIYNSEIKASYLLVSNGLTHFFLKQNPEGKFIFLSEIPEYNKLLLSPE